MSRSRRKTPKIGMCGGRHHPSEKKEKQLAHRKERAKVRKLLGTYGRGYRKVLPELLDEVDAPLLPHFREIDDVWGRSKDGKIRFDPKDPKWQKYMRK